MCMLRVTGVVRRSAGARAGAGSPCAASLCIRSLSRRLVFVYAVSVLHWVVLLLLYRM